MAVALACSAIGALRAGYDAPGAFAPRRFAAATSVARWIQPPRLGFPHLPRVRRYPLPPGEVIGRLASLAALSASTAPAPDEGRVSRHSRSSDRDDPTQRFVIPSAARDLGRGSVSSRFNPCEARNKPLARRHNSLRRASSRAMRPKGRLPKRLSFPSGDALSRARACRGFAGLGREAAGRRGAWGPGSARYANRNPIACCVARSWG